MEIQTNPIFTAKTPRVKCITSHPSFPDVLVCLFNGELRLYDPKTFNVKKSAVVCDCPIRTAVIVPSMDCIFVGNDNGCILTVELGNLSVVETVKAHNDFVRKIVVDEHNQRMITVSDDNRTKLWSFGNGVVLINKYKDSKHYVMDVSLYPGDNGRFLTASLDAKVRMYSVASTNLLKTFKGHENGVNTIAFIGPDTFVTGADDRTVRVWDVKRQTALAVLRGHTKNVSTVRALKNGFASCSEDGTVRFWTNDEYKLVEVLNMAGRVWDLYSKDGKIFVGCDEELCVFQEHRSASIAVLREGKVFYNIKNTIFTAKTDELGAYRELGTIEDSFESFSVNPNGKLIGVVTDSHVTVNSTLGMRKKYSDNGKDIYFVDSDKFVYLKDSEIVTVSKNEIESSIHIENLQRILYANTEYMILDVGKTAVYKIGSQDPIHDLGISVVKATIIREHFVLFGDQIHIYNKKFEKIATLDYTVIHFAEHEGILFFSTSNKTFYLIIYQNKVHASQVKYYGNLVGLRNNMIFYFSNGIITDVIDIGFINFKRDFLDGTDVTPSDKFRDKAIAFFESLGLHERALELCTDENQRFEILIKLNRLDDALSSANSPIKYAKLGKKFLDLNKIEKASECFKKSNDLDSLFLTDIFGKKKYLEYVATKARETGRNNLALLAAYKAKNYKQCADLLKDTPFYLAFNQSYLQ